MMKMNNAGLAAAGFLGLFLIATPVQASNWLHCAGSATVTATTQDENGVWQLVAEAAGATVTDGFGTIGADCAEANGAVTIASDQEIPAGQIVRFKYEYYGGLGPQGPVTSRTWVRVE